MKGEKVENLRDMEAIFGDDQFYKDEAEEQPRDDLDIDDINLEPKESEYDMDKYYKIPVQYGKASFDSNGYSKCVAIFWYKDFDDMMHLTSIGLTIGLYNDLQDFYEEPDVSAVEIDGERVVQQSKLILSKARSTGLNKA